MRFGKSEPKIDPRTLKLSRYMGEFDVPERMDWSIGRYGPLANNRIGNCTAVTAHHLTQTWSQARGSGNYYKPTAAQAVRTYAKFTGYDDATGKRDNGAVVLDVLRKWRKEGLSTGHKAHAFAQVDDDSIDSIKAACWLFGGLYLGFALPSYVEGEYRHWSSPGSKRGPTTKPYSGGGHAVAMLGYTKEHALIASWGAKIQVAWGFVDKYLDEAYAVLSKDWATDGLAPNGFAFDALNRDLDLIHAKGKK